MWWWCWRWWCLWRLMWSTRFQLLGRRLLPESGRRERPRPRARLRSRPQPLGGPPRAGSRGGAKQQEQKALLLSEGGEEVLLLVSPPPSFSTLPKRPDSAFRGFSRLAIIRDLLFSWGALSTVFDSLASIRIESALCNFRKKERKREKSTRGKEKRQALDCIPKLGQNSPSLSRRDWGGPAAAAALMATRLWPPCVRWCRQRNDGGFTGARESIVIVAGFFLRTSREREIERARFFFVVAEEKVSM